MASKTPLTFHVITLFPELFQSYFSYSMMHKAQESKHMRIVWYNPRDYTTNKHKNVDDKPYGGGPGMVIQAEPVLRAYDVAIKKITRKKQHAYHTVIFSPRGDLFCNEIAQEYVDHYTDIILVCGRYEGIDVRFQQAVPAQELSIGPYVVTGGELPAMVVIDCVTRRIPGVLGHAESIEEHRTSTGHMYTRPQSFIYKKQEYKVPPIVVSGNHQDIEQWRKSTSTTSFSEKKE